MNYSEIKIFFNLLVSEIFSVFIEEKLTGVMEGSLQWGVESRFVYITSSLNSEKSSALLASFKNVEKRFFSIFVSTSFNPLLQIAEQNKINEE